VLATAHRDHDTANNVAANLAAFCQRCHINHDRPEHRRRRWRTLFRRRAIRTFFEAPTLSEFLAVDRIGSQHQRMDRG
jgi:hypothetical protein